MNKQSPSPSMPSLDPKMNEDLARVKAFLEYLQDSSKRGNRADDAQMAELNMGRTPHQVLYNEGSCRLLEYDVLGGPKRKIPILMIYSFINRYYILDLQPNHSFIEALSKQGFQVYLLDWGIPGAEHATLGLEYYLETVARRAVERIRRKHDNVPLTLFGYCLGGTLAGIMAGLHPNDFAGLVLLTTPLSFREAGILSFWTNKEFFDPSRLSKAFGVIPEDILHASFPLMQPKATLSKPRVLFDNILNEDYIKNFKSIDRWATDNVPFPGKVFQEFIGGCYQDNLLAQNKLMVGKKRVDLDAVRCPTLNLFATHDHIVPPAAARKNAEVLRNSRVQNNEYPVAHLTVTVAHPVREQVWGDTVRWLDKEGLGG